MSSGLDDEWIWSPHYRESWGLCMKHGFFFPCSGMNHIMGSSLLFLIGFEATKCPFLTWDALDLVYKWGHSFRTLQLDVVVIALSLRYLKPRVRYCPLHGSHIWRWLAPCLTQLTNGLECRSAVRVNPSQPQWWRFVGAYMCMRHNKNTGNEAHLLKVVWSACFIERAGHTLYACACSSHTRQHLAAYQDWT